MSAPARPATLAGEVHDGRTRLFGDDARRRFGVDTGPQPLVLDPVPPFSLGGPLFLSTSSPHRTVARRFTSVQIDLTVAGTSTTTVTVYKNGVSQGTAGIGSGVQSTIVGLAWTAAANDRVTVGVTAIGTGAQGITVVLA